ncbi:MAG: ABC transporter ATP-binding protein, partial [Anaerolineae bacterium]
EGIVTYTIPALPLLEGLYYISVSAHNWEDTEMYDYHDRMYAFRVLPVGGERYGVVTLMGMWNSQESPIC